MMTMSQAIKEAFGESGGALSKEAIKQSVGVTSEETLADPFYGARQMVRHLRRVGRRRAV